MRVSKKRKHPDSARGQEEEIEQVKDLAGVAGSFKFIHIKIAENENFQGNFENRQICRV